jgi:hypothetical protein
MMEDAINRGFSFEFAHLWRSSTYKLTQDRDESLFEAPQFSLPLLPEKGTAYEGIIGPPDLNLPDLGHDGGLEVELDDLARDSIEPGQASSHQDAGDASQKSDIWSFDLATLTTEDVPSLCTWEAFEKNPVPNAEHTTYLSEAGAAAFDAALLSPDTEGVPGVLPQDASIRALCNLALGRSSIFFQWDESKKFYQTLPDVTISGLSDLCSSSFSARIMAYGLGYRSLLDWTEDNLEPARTNPATTALQRVAARVLQAVEADIIGRLAHVRSLLQLQGILEHPFELVSHLQAIREAAGARQAEVETISAVSDRIHAITTGGSLFSSVLSTILAETCAPWLEELSAELGLSGDPARSLLKDNDRFEVDNEAVDQTLGDESSSVETGVSLLEREDQKLVRETKATLKLLRLHLPDHASLMGKSATDAHSKGSDETSESMWNDELVLQRNMAAIDAQILGQPGTSIAPPDDRIKIATQNALTQDNAGSLDLDTASGLRPFEKLRPQIELQSLRLNRVLLGHMLQTCHLRKHLDLQHAFHLMGSGEFLTRLTTALFSPETQSARRTKGAIPTGETLGLRLGVEEGQRWPPASSELRLTLNGIISETHRDLGSSVGPQFGKQNELLGGLSFTVRQLPDAEIDRVMDATSLYALDFLKLQYSAPAPLDSVLTNVSMERYDDIFRILLRIIRVLDATTRLRRRFSSRDGAIRLTAARFAFQAHCFASNLMGCLMDFGIGVPWKRFQAVLDDMERSLNEEDSTAKRTLRTSMTIASLRELHEGCLDTIRSRLFLKRKQEKVRMALENVLIAILKGACALGAFKSSSEYLPHLGQVIKDALASLQDMLDRSRRRSEKGVGEDEAEMGKLLLVRLNYSNFYS